jgi:8-oxo-dGTP diphosphatase
MAGRWELPGGKVEPGERETDALVRELSEELGIRVEVGRRIGPDVAVGERTVLRCLAARPVEPQMLDGPAGTLVSTDHDEMRWLTAAQLDDVEWLEPDGKLAVHLRAVLAGH